MTRLPLPAAAHAHPPAACEELGRKRIIARCTVAGEDLGEWMVSQGLALAYRRYSHDYVGEEADAQAARYLGQQVRETLGVAPGQAARQRPVKSMIPNLDIYRTPNILVREHGEVVSPLSGV